MHPDTSPSPAALGETDDSGGTGPFVLLIRPGSNGWATFTVQRRAPGEAFRESPCGLCPFRRDTPTGRFGPEVFRYSARTTYDLATATFGCHSDPQDPHTCAGFLLRGASDNLTVRATLADLSTLHSDVALYKDYREMAIANGVDPDDPALTPCRGDRTATITVNGRLRLARRGEVPDDRFGSR